MANYFFPVEGGKKIYFLLLKRSRVSLIIPGATQAAAQHRANTLSPLLHSQFNSNEATISNKAVKMHQYSRIALYASAPPS